MSNPAPPPPIKIPQKLIMDDELRDFFQVLLRSNYFVWERVGRNLSVDGVVGLYGQEGVDQAAALTASNTSTVDATYGSEEAAVINNLRIRLDELEAALDSATGIGIVA